MMDRHELTDEQWARLSPLLPPERPHRGRPNHDHRRVVNGMLWRLATGAPWRDLPPQYGSWRTVYSRFRRWQRAGVFDRMLADLQRAGDATGTLDWTLHFVDGSVVRAHQHAAGAKGDPPPRRSVAAAVGSVPRSTSVPSAVGSPSSSP
jgi:transposase